MEGHEITVLLAIAFSFGLGLQLGFTFGEKSAKKVFLKYYQTNPMRLLEEAVNELYNFRK